MESSVTADGYTPFVWAASDDADVHSTYLKCLESGATDASGTPVDMSPFKLVGFFEGKYDCAGICTTPLFYVSKPLSAGIPTEECLKGIQEQIAGSTMYVGVVALICGILMLCAWIMQYCLWKKFD